MDNVVKTVKFCLIKFQKTKSMWGEGKVEVNKRLLSKINLLKHKMETVH